MMDLEFKNGDPGAVKHGNFINYSSFHPAITRLNQIPMNVFKKASKFIGFDVGCNAGDLTLALQDALQQNICKECYIFGIDIDPILIERAEQYKSTFVSFKCLDVTNEKLRNNYVTNYLNDHKVEKFDVTFCFSTTMWIHLNHGDEGLRNFLKYIKSISHMLIIEPQKWNSYKSAIRRLKRSNCKETLKFNELTIRNDVDKQIENILIEFGAKLIHKSDSNEWNRNILIFN